MNVEFLIVMPTVVLRFPPIIKIGDGTAVYRRIAGERGAFDKGIIKRIEQSAAIAAFIKSGDCRVIVIGRIADAFSGGIIRKSAARYRQADIRGVGIVCAVKFPGGNGAAIFAGHVPGECGTGNGNMGT